MPFLYQQSCFHWERTLSPHLLTFEQQLGPSVFRFLTFDTPHEMDALYKTMRVSVFPMVTNFSNSEATEPLQLLLVRARVPAATLRP